MGARSSPPPGRSEAQQSFDEIGTHLSQVTFCVVDLETTGGAEDDTITEFGAVKVRGGEVLGEFQTLVNPQTAIPPLIAVLTGITNQLVAGAPTLAQVLPSFLAFASDSVIVAHNAAFDTGFLRRACEKLGYPPPRWTVVDTVGLARQILLRDEVPNCRLATLARHFKSRTEPNHRALTDARATVDVLHGLLERVGNLGVHTIEDLAEFTRRVSPQRRAKRTWAADLPTRAGVYLFVAEHDDGPERGRRRQVLYVGKSTNLRARVRTYFTAAETRPRMDEMVRLSTGVETIVCDTPLQAEVTELRLIAAHAPPYNRRSKYPERSQWIKITDEAFPRLSIVRAVKDDAATYFGPFHRRQAAEDVVLAIYDGFPIRQCSPRLSVRHPVNACALAGMGRCCAPCDGSVTPETYGTIVEQVRTALSTDVRPAVAGVSERLGRLIEQQRFEEADVIRRRLDTLTRTGRRFHRVRSLAACPEIVAAYKRDDDWEIHVIRFGRLAGTGVATPRDVPQAVARDVRATAETVFRPPGPLPAAGIEETERIADWLEQPGTRIIDIVGDWMWPLHAVLDHEGLVRHALSHELTHTVTP
ncbi:DEDD exonuclease domain-containing protein [Microlunatus ginsengisoli]